MTGPVSRVLAPLAATGANSVQWAGLARGNARTCRAEGDEVGGHLWDMVHQMALAYVDKIGQAEDAERWYRPRVSRSLDRVDAIARAMLATAIHDAETHEPGQLGHPLRPGPGPGPGPVVVRVPKAVPADAEQTADGSWEWRRPAENRPGLELRYTTDGDGRRFGWSLVHADGFDHDYGPDGACACGDRLAPLPFGQRPSCGSHSGWLVMPAGIDTPTPAGAGPSGVIAAHAPAASWLQPGDADLPADDGPVDAPT